MNDLLLHQVIQCPYCWEQIGIDLDLSVEGQSYIEDCQVCCQPIRITYRSDNGELADLEATQDT